MKFGVRPFPSLSFLINLVMVNIYRIHVVKFFKCKYGGKNSMQKIFYEDHFNGNLDVLNIQQKCSYFHRFQDYING